MKLLWLELQFEPRQEDVILVLRPTGVFRIERYLSHCFESEICKAPIPQPNMYRIVSFPNQQRAPSPPPSPVHVYFRAWRHSKAHARVVVLLNLIGQSFIDCFLFGIKMSRVTCLNYSILSFLRICLKFAAWNLSSLLLNRLLTVLWAWFCL